MTFVSLSLITTWMTLLVMDVTMRGFVHVLLLAAAAIVFLSGNRVRRRFVRRPPPVAPVFPDTPSR